MKQRIIAALALGLEMKLNPDTADDTLAVHVEKMAQELISNKAELAKVKKETAEAKADIFVANLIEAKKITEEEAPQVKKDAIENYDLTARIYNKIPGVQKASQGINQQLGAEATDKRNWTFKDYQEKDSKGLLEMREKNKPLYMKLYEAHYGRPCVIAD